MRVVASTGEGPVGKVAAACCRRIQLMERGCRLIVRKCHHFQGHLTMQRQQAACQDQRE